MNWNGLDLPAKDKVYFQDDDCVIYCADCQEILPLIHEKSIDLVLTDPPYGITNQEWDRLPDWDFVGGQIQRLGKDDCQIFLFGMQPTYSQMVIGLQKYLYFKDELIWYYKDGGAGNTKGTGLKNVHQNIAWYSTSIQEFILNIDALRIEYQPNERNKYPVKRGKRIWTPNPLGAYPTNVFEIPKHKELIAGKTQFHEHYTIKPLRLFARLVNGFSQPNGLILDMYLGTGTTTLASLKSNRKCIGIEIKEKYCEIAKNRLSQSVMKL